MEPTSILIVDDNADLLETFSRILKNKGYRVGKASDGAHAVDEYARQPFDVVLMDMVMPRMNGAEAFRHIMKMNPAAKIILMTAYTKEEQLLAAVDEGAFCTLHKPVDVLELMQLIEKAAVNPVVMIVDDDREFCQVLARALELKGYPVVPVNSGAEALDLARKKQFSVALIDFKMPHMNGLETHTRLKELNPQMSSIIMTGYREEMGADIGKALQGSEVDCLYKPFAPSKVMEVINRLKRKNLGRKPWQQKILFS